jgi:hypothetical protein
LLDHFLAGFAAVRDYQPSDHMVLGRALLPTEPLQQPVPTQPAQLMRPLLPRAMMISPPVDTRREEPAYAEEVDDGGRAETAARVREEVDDGGRAETAARVREEVDDGGRAETAARVREEVDDGGRAETAARVRELPFEARAAQVKAAAAAAADTAVQGAGRRVAPTHTSASPSRGRALMGRRLMCAGRGGAGLPHPSMHFHCGGIIPPAVGA